MALREHQTPKQEAFTMAHVETGNATEAYRRSYEPQNWTDNALSVQASKMLRHPKIVLRLDQLQRAHAERHEITVDGITSELEEARKLAMATGNPNAAVSAAMGKAKLHGLLTDRLDHGGKGDGMTYSAGTFITHILSA